MVLSAALSAVANSVATRAPRSSNGSLMHSVVTVSHKSPILGKHTQAKLHHCSACTEACAACAGEMLR